MATNNTKGQEDGAKAKEELKNNVQNAKEQAKGTARDATEELKGAAQDTKQDLKGTAQGLKQEAMGIKDRVQEQLQSSVKEQRSKAANELHGFAEAFRKTGEELRNQEYGFIANYTEQVADKIEQVSDMLENREIGQYVESVERFARQQPLLFIGGATMLGVLAARFLKSSSAQVGQGSQTGGNAQYGGR
jgi:ElaB/YqjD/DUF883 family membrane-anchored ribosome-binding protein